MDILSSLLVSFMLFDFMSHGAPKAIPDQESVQSVVSGTGTLTVVTSAPESIGSIPRGATRIPFLTISMSASCDGDIRIHSIDVKHTGLGKSDDISSVYAVNGFTRVTRAARFGRNGVATLRFRNAVIPKCGAMQLSVMGDSSPDATIASEHSVKLTGAYGVSSTSKRTTFSETSDEKKAIAVTTNAGTLSVRMLPMQTHPRYGRIETVARIQLSADLRSSQLLKRITLKNRGDARDMDLQWITIERLSGSVLTTAAPRMRGTSVTLDFNPTHVLQRGSTLVVNVKAEVHGSQSKTIDFVIEEPSDVVSSPYHER